jgi:glucoamylase
MAILKQDKKAWGGPGIEPRWTRSAKEGVGTAYSASSRVWFTLSTGILNEVYYPTIDHPQIRDLQFLVTDGATFFHDERHLVHEVLEYLDDHVLGFKIINSDPNGRYKIVKEIITNPHQSAVLIHTSLQGDENFLKKIHLFVLLAPHLEIGGWGNNGYVAVAGDREFLVANKAYTWLALGATVPFSKRSCGYVGTTDGWRDLKENFQMDWEFDCAENGNIALIGELDHSQTKDFILGLAFGHGLNAAITTLLQSLCISYESHRERFIEQWKRTAAHLLPLEKASCDGGHLYRVSHSLLEAHEDKSYPGAMIASLSIPWGEVKGDEDLGGYHLVWTRDMVHSATGLLATGNLQTPLRALIYLASVQCPDGGFFQNFWISGEPYWRGVQLDEVAFPILLAWRLKEANALQDFDPYPMVMKAATYLILNGPATPQERWEENSGYSPSTLASNIVALICAACFARSRKDEETACFLEAYADFLECHVEVWTVTENGTLVPGIKRHFVRINPIDPADPTPDESLENKIVPIRNQPPGAPFEFPAKEIVDAGFLELVRYGIRKPGDSLVEDSLKVVDAFLKVDTPFGPCWHRYNHDGFGQCEDGSPYQGAGKGRAWPLLTGERGHYELACGRDVRLYIQAMERFASTTGLLPEQVWDEPDRPEIKMYLGKPTGSAMPLMWAHAEYIKLLRSRLDGKVWDTIPAVVEHYITHRHAFNLEFWKFNRQPKSIKPGMLLRILVQAPFVLHWTKDEWLHTEDTRSIPTSLGIEYVDIQVPMNQKAPIRFTFFWPQANRWEGRDFQVSIK